MSTKLLNARPAIRKATRQAEKNFGTLTTPFVEVKGENKANLRETLFQEEGINAQLLHEMQEALVADNPTSRQFDLRRIFMEKLQGYMRHVLYERRNGAYLPRQGMTPDQMHAYMNPVPFGGSYHDSPSRHVAEALRRLQEASGGGRIGPDDHSILVPKDGDTYLNMLARANMEVDTMLLNFTRTVPSTQAVEKYDEFGVFINYVRMSREGQVQLGYLAESEFLIPNYEYGAGMGFKWEWFEDNVANFKINSFAQDFVYYALENKMNIGHTLFAATKTTAYAYSNTVIETLNGAWATLLRLADTVDTDKLMFNRGAQFYIYAPLELAWVFDLAFRAPMDSRSAERLQFRPVVYLTNRLAAGNDFYFGVSNWKREGLQQRTPLTAHGPEQNIRTFTTDITYRERFNWFMTAENTRKITLPALSSIKIYRLGDNA